jgi:predicted site-specific integrase-resolvase
MFDWVPNLGELATIIGIVLSIVLIYTHWRKGRIEYKKTQLEITILMEKEAERLENANRRKEEAHL